MMSIISYIFSKLSISNIVSILLCIAVGGLLGLSHLKSSQIESLKVQEAILKESLASANDMLGQCSKATEELQKRAKQLADHKKKKEEQAAKIRSTGQENANRIMQDKVGDSCQESVQYGISKLPAINKEWDSI